MILFISTYLFVCFLRIKRRWIFSELSVRLLTSVLCHLSATHINNLLGTKIDKLIWSIIHTSFTVVNDLVLAMFLLLLKSSLTIRGRQNSTQIIYLLIFTLACRQCVWTLLKHGQRLPPPLSATDKIPPHHEADTQSQKVKRRQVSSSFISRLTQSSD